MKDAAQTLTPTEPAPAEQVLVLPGHLFFIETIHVPVDLEPAEIPDFIELSLESIAPFPVEQLNWGFLYSEDAPTILVYATHRDRLKNAGYTNLQAYAWVLPDFATLTGACFPDQTLVALESANTLSLLLFDKGVNIPHTALVASLANGDVDQALKELMASAPDLPKAAATLRVRTGAIGLSEQGLASFNQESADDSSSALEYGAWTTLAPTEAQLWQSDVRSADFKVTERSTRRLGTLLMRITAWAAIFALVLVGIEILLLASQAWLSTVDKQIESQRTAVLMIEDKQALMVKLEQVAKNELRPIAILDAANNIRLRLKLGIEYDSVIVEGENHITIEGKATSINALNSYTDSLKQSDQFTLIAGPELFTRAGETTFKVTLAYTHIQVVTPVEAKETQVAPESTTSTEEATI
ncbi:MAG: hypothetical protein ACI9FZ_000301 [Bacteroidia bacterium]